MRKKQRLTEDPRSLSKQLQNSKGSSINQISVSEESINDQESPFYQATEDEAQWTQNLNQVPYTSNKGREEKKSSPFAIASLNSDLSQFQFAEQIEAFLPISQSQPNFLRPQENITQEFGILNDEVARDGIKTHTKKTIQLIVRIRPLLESESPKKCLEIEGAKNEIRLFREYQKTDFKFDGMILQSQKQPDVFFKVQNIVQNFLLGSNGTIFAYGQTGAGKTFTIVGKTLDELSEGIKNKPQGSQPSSPSLKKKKRTPSGFNLISRPKSRNKYAGSQTFDVPLKIEKETLSDHSGIIPRSIQYIFENMKSGQKVQISFVEIYNDKVLDLLNPSGKGKGHKKQQSSYSGSSKSHAFNMNLNHKAAVPQIGHNLEIREERDGSFTIPDLSKTQVQSFEEALRAFQMGLEKRQVSATLQNSQSSRSHSIFQVYLEDERGKESSLRIVDLAGSEKYSLKKDLSGNEKQQRVQELTQINSSLSALGQCISALGDQNRKHIPYRNSKLTKILKDSLDIESYIALIVCISPSFDSYKETLSTLQFADRAKKAVLDGRAFEKMSKSSKRESGGLSEYKEKEYQIKIKELQNENLQLASQIKELKSSSIIETELRKGILIKEGQKKKKNCVVKFNENLLNEDSIDSELKERIEHNLMYNDDRIFENISIFNQEDDSVVQEKKALPLNDFHPLMLIKKKQQEAGSLIDRLKDKKLKKFWNEGEAPPIEDDDEEEENEKKIDDKMDDEDDKMAVHVSMSQEIGGSGGSGGNDTKTKEIMSPEVSEIQTGEKEPKAFKNLTNLSSVENDKSAMGLMSSMLMSLEADEVGGLYKEESQKERKDNSTINNLSQIYAEQTSPKRLFNNFLKKKLAVEQQMGVSPIQEISSGSFSRDLMEIAAQKKGKKNDQEEEKISLEFDTSAHETKKAQNPDIGEVSEIIKAEFSQVYSNKSEGLNVMEEEEDEKNQKLLSFPSQLLEESAVNPNQESMIINEAEAAQGDTLLLDSNSIILDTGGEILRPDQSFDTSKIKDFLSPRSDAFFDVQGGHSQASGEDQMFTYSLTNTFSTLKSLREGIESQRGNSKVMKQIHKFAKEQKDSEDEEDFQNKRDKFENYTKQFYDQILKEIVTLKQLLMQSKEQKVQVPLGIKVIQRQKLKQAQSLNMGIKLNSPAKAAINSGLVQAKQELHKALKTKKGHQSERIRLKNLLKLLEQLQNELKKPLTSALTLSNQKKNEIMIPIQGQTSWSKSPKNGQQQSPSMNLMINSHQRQPNGDLGESAVMDDVDQTRYGQSIIASGETQITGRAFQFPNFYGPDLQLRNSKVGNVTHDSVAFESEVNLVGSSLKKQTLESHHSKKNLLDNPKSEKLTKEQRQTLNAKDFLSHKTLLAKHSNIGLQKYRQTPDFVPTDPTQHQSFGQHTNNPFLARSRKELSQRHSESSSIGTENALPHLIGAAGRLYENTQTQEQDKTLLLNPSQDSNRRRHTMQEEKHNSLEDLSALEESGISPLFQGSPGFRDEQKSFAFMLQSMIQMSKEQKFDERGVINEENEELDLSKFGASIDQSSLLPLNVQEGQTQFLVRQSPVFRAAVKQMQDEQKKKDETEWKPMPKLKKKSKKKKQVLEDNFFQDPINQEEYILNRNAISPKAFESKSNNASAVMEEEESHRVPPMQTKNQKIFGNQNQGSGGGSSKGSVKKYWQQFFEQQQ